MQLVNERSKQTFALINTLPSDSFLKLVTRILRKVDVQGETILNDEEVSKFEQLTRLSSTDIENIILVCAYLFQRAAYDAMNGPGFQDFLLTTNLSPTYTDLMVKIWSTEGINYINRLSKNIMNGPVILKNSIWAIDMQIAESTTGTTKKLNSTSAILELDLCKEDSIEKVALEFSHDELFDFFKKLDQIQDQLDSVGGA